MNSGVQQTTGSVGMNGANRCEGIVLSVKDRNRPISREIRRCTQKKDGLARLQTETQQAVGCISTLTRQMAVRFFSQLENSSKLFRAHALCVRYSVK